MASANQQPIVHFVGSIPLPDAETVFRTLSEMAGPHLRRLPDVIALLIAVRLADR